MEGVEGGVGEGGLFLFGGGEGHCSREVSVEKFLVLGESQYWHNWVLVVEWVSPMLSIVYRLRYRLQ